MSLPSPAAPDLLTHTFLAMERVAPDPGDVYFGVLLRCGGTAPALSEVREQVASRLAAVPALTHRLTDEPAWEPDPHFDIEQHIGLLDVPVRATAIRELMPTPPAHDRPLWRMWVADCADRRGPRAGRGHPRGRRRGRGRRRCGACGMMAPTPG
ncbi:wax ester/triacylglycerol synthase domain-containing protein [Nocardia sp. BMG111209]|uniref:wax ester/triacylglycerol synthase domain-containing protein n=1 Tax=Nocardia sp. BMG111209 TaxID=1160137 RepID=UPI0003642DDB|nr:wax ester/triacylglycerol synthase domain-containing protein [Nocardia sp. BMG111209]